MSKVLLVRSSIFGDTSKSLRLAREFLKVYPHNALVERILTPDSMPHLSGETYIAMGKPATELTPEQKTAVALSDELIAEVEAADTIVLTAPMYNFTIPSTLKAWFDHIARAGRTFRYTAQGPQGLLKGKRVIVLIARGGNYSQGPMQAFDFQTGYLRAVLGFLGMTDVTFINFEGLAMSPDAANQSFDRARAVIDDVLAQPLVA